MGEAGVARRGVGEEGAQSRGAPQAAAPATSARELLGLDASRHRWFQDGRWYDLVEVVDDANRFLRESYIPEINPRFCVPAAEKGHAFVPMRGQDLERIFSGQHERVVANGNTVRRGERLWQLERTRWRGTLAGGRVTICEHLDGRVMILNGPQLVGRYAPEGRR